MAMILLLKYLNRSNGNGNGRAVVPQPPPTYSYQMDLLIAAFGQFHGDFREFSQDFASFQRANERKAQERHDESQGLRLQAITTIQQWRDSQKGAA
jgi:hypothetical protein